jgi:hypothetical protein
MNAIIYSSTDAPWEDGGSQIEQWESGLVRVTQNYLVPRADKETIASSNFARGLILSGIASPSTDDLYIYPDPTIADANNGLSRISVTAYGRKAGEYSLEVTYIQRDINSDTGIVSYYVPQYRIKFVTIQGEPPIPDFLDDLKFRDTIFLVEDGQLIGNYTGRRAFTFESSPSSGYGAFQEQVFTMTVSPSFGE